MSAPLRLFGLGSLAAAALLLPATPALAAFGATGTDPTGDAIAGGPDLTDAGLGYDPDTGELVGAVRFASPPGERAFLTIYAGRKAAGGCDGSPAIGFGSFTDESDASWLRLEDSNGNGPRGDADKTGGGDSVQRFETKDPKLKRARPECVMANVTERGNPANVYDTLGPFGLEGLPGLSVKVRRVPRQKLKLGQARRIRITVTNTGDGTARGVKLRLAPRRGLKSSPRVRKIGTLFKGRRKTVTVKVKLVGGARDTTEVPVTASMGKLKAETEFELRRRAKKSPPSSGGGGGSSTSPPPRLCNRFSPDPFGDTGGSLILVPC